MENDKAEQDKIRLEQFQREREERKRLARLRQEEEAAERERQRQSQTNNFKSNDKEHYVDSNLTAQCTEQEIEEQCDKLFQAPPIEFNPQKGNSLDEEISNILQQHHIAIPIINIRDKLYLIGSNRMTCDFRSDAAMIKVGGGYQRFDEYIVKNHRHH